MQKKNISLIVIGHSERSRIEAWVRGSVVNEIIRKGSPIQVLVVEGGGEEPKNEDQFQSIDRKNYLNIKTYLRPFTVSLVSICNYNGYMLFFKTLFRSY